MCNSNALFTANSNMNLINAANPNLNGTGAINTILTAANNGTIVKTIIINARGNTSLGMVRLYIFDGVTNYLFREVMIPANFQTGVVQAFQTTISDSFLLQSGYELRASTQNADSFSISAFGDDWTNCSC